MKLQLYVTLVFLLRSIHSERDGYFYLSYKTNDGSDLIVDRGDVPINQVGKQWAASAFYNSSMNSTGWDVLEITSNPDLSDDDQAYQAGFLEGFLTQIQIYYHWYNTNKYICSDNKPVCNKIKQYLQQNKRWMNNEIQDKPNVPYWYQVRLYMWQMYGVYNGYRHAVKVNNNSQHLQYEDIMLMNYLTDILTLQDSLSKKANSSSGVRDQHCSVLIKILPGYSDVIFAHNTWLYYSFMNRILKRYNLAFHISQNSSKLIPGQKVTFSSYPAIIGSTDDFYVINSGLIITETTESIYNSSVYKDIKPTGQVLESIRSIIANRLATDGKSWSSYFSQMNSGTYNNQWMIIDLKRFTPGVEPRENFLWVLEQMPGKIVAEDQTHHLLALSYWASYNVPFYKSIYQAQGISYKKLENSPRAKIFERIENSVMDVQSMIKVIRYNHYRTDPYSKSSPCLSISARCDLRSTKDNESSKPFMFGGIDSKVCSFSMFRRGELISISGPTTSDGLPPFRWSSVRNNTDKHLGQPDLWNFRPLLTSWTLPYQGIDNEARPNFSTVLKLSGHHDYMEDYNRLEPA